MNMDDIIAKLTDYGVLGIITFILLNKVINKLDEIEECLKELKGLLQGLAKHG
jgi:uncharacterized protein YoxC